MIEIGKEKHLVPLLSIWLLTVVGTYLISQFGDHPGHPPTVSIEGQGITYGIFAAMLLVGAQLIWLGSYLGTVRVFWVCLGLGLVFLFVGLTMKSEVAASCGFSCRTVAIAVPFSGLLVQFFAVFAASFVVLIVTHKNRLAVKPVGNGILLFLYSSPAMTITLLAVCAVLIP